MEQKKKNKLYFLSTMLYFPTIAAATLIVFHGFWTFERECLCNIVLSSVCFLFLFVENDDKFEVKVDCVDDDDDDDDDDDGDDEIVFSS